MTDAAIFAADISRLDDWRAALLRMATVERDAVEAFQSRLRRFEAAVDQEQSRWRWELERRRADLADAEGELWRCERSGDEDNAPDCAEYEALVARCERRCWDAEAALADLGRLQWELGEVIAGLSPTVGMFLTQVETALPLAAAQVAEAATALRAVKQAPLHRFDSLGLRAGRAGSRP